MRSEISIKLEAHTQFSNIQFFKTSNKVLEKCAILTISS